MKLSALFSTKPYILPTHCSYVYVSCDFLQYTPFLPSTMFTDWCFHWKEQCSLWGVKFYIYCWLMLVLKAVLRHWIVGHWPRRTGCDPRPISPRFVLADLALVLPFSPISTIPSLSRIYLQPGATLRRTRSRGPWTYKQPMFFRLLGEELDGNVLPRCCVVFKRSGNDVIFVYY